MAVESKLRSVSQRVVNGVVYGRFDSNEELDAYGAKLKIASLGSQEDFSRFLRKNPPTPDTVNLVEGLFSGGIGFFGKELVGAERAALNSRTTAATHVREASNLLKEAGLKPLQRNQILNSFDLETFRVDHVLESRYEYRFFDDVSAELKGRYTSPNFLENQTDRIVQFAFPKNSATQLGIVEIPKGSIPFYW
jgi:hypothetical protein